MPRLPRIHYSQAVYHVISRGVDKRPIYSDESDFRAFLVMLKEDFSAFGLSLFSYCLMTNHFHLLLAVSSVPLAAPMQHLLSRYSTRFNLLHERVGHLFQGRYTALLCEDIPYLTRLIGYIHLNPVRAGLVNGPESWAWSSHREFLTGEGGLLRLDRLSETTGLPLTALQENYKDSLTELVRTASAPTALDDILASVASRNGITPTELRSGKRGDIYTRAKTEFLRRALAADFTEAAIARCLNCTRAAVTLLKQRNC